MDVNAQRWLRNHGLTERDAAAWGVSFTDGQIRIPAQSISGGRLFELVRNFGAGQKYVIVPEHCKPSGWLFGLREALPHIRELRSVVVVEGPSDVMAAHKTGVKNAVATMTADLRGLQRSIALALAEQMVLLFDGDEAGERGAKAVAELELPNVMTATISGMDPGLFVAKGGKLKWVVDYAGWAFEAGWAYVEINPHALHQGAAPVSGVAR